MRRALREGVDLGIMKWFICMGLLYVKIHLNWHYVVPMYGTALR